MATQEQGMGTRSKFVGRLAVAAVLTLSFTGTIACNKKKARNHDAEERYQHEKHPAPGQRPWRLGSAHVNTPLGLHGDTK